MFFLKLFFIFSQFILKDFLPKIKFEPYISFINITLKYTNPAVEETPTENEQPPKNLLPEKTGFLESFSEYCTNFLKTGSAKEFSVFF